LEGTLLKNKKTDLKKWGGFIDDCRNFSTDWLLTLKLQADKFPAEHLNWLYSFVA
jgi:hypothetical protein